MESTDEVFFAANSGGTLGMSDINHNSKVGKISVKEAEKALSAPGNNGTIQVSVTEVSTIYSLASSVYLPCTDSLTYLTLYK